MPDEGLAPEGQNAPAEGEPVVVDEWADLPPLEDGIDQFPRPVVEDLRNREAKYRIAARDTRKKIDEWGGEEKVQEAMRLQNLLGTDDGVTALFIEAGQALGLNAAQLEALFAGEQLSPEAQAAQDEELDRVLTVREANEMVAEALKKNVLEPQAQAQQERNVQVARDTIQSEFDALEVSEEDKQFILDAGTRYIQDGDFNPDHIRAAVRKGHADYSARLAAAAAAYVDGKVGDINGTVQTIGGTPPGGETVAEPQSVEEAKALVRKQLRTGTGAFGGRS